MKYLTINPFEKEIHPWQPYIPSNANKLIIGTFPTAKENRKSDFFYPNPNNEFWKLIAEVASNEVTTKQIDLVELRKAYLKHLKLGITDIGKIILRQKNSSKDSNIFPLEFTDIFCLLDDFPNIKKLIITSSTVALWFQAYCKINQVFFNIPEGTLPKRTTIEVHSKIIVISIISSPSRQSRIKGEALYNQYKNSILNI